MLSPDLLLKCFYYLFMIMISFLQTSHGKQSPYCSPSACGHIRNISYPFRLRDDPQHCGVPKYQLSCENNTTTILYLGSQNYHVQAINYENHTIHLTDPTIKKNDTCSSPLHSLSRYDLRVYSPYDNMFVGHAMPMPTPITFMSCPRPVSNSALFLETSEDCFSQSGNYKSHTYIRFGDLKVSDVTNYCRIDIMAMSSLRVKDENNVSLSEIHSSLLYGFELSFLRRRPLSCRIYCSCLLPAYIKSAICRCDELSSRRDSRRELFVEGLKWILLILSIGAGKPLVCLFTHFSC
ncbi:hypothetical protein CDL12_18914 [Handroanthus impetiginosus]|uniref:Wall-associated receptor kinase galacturonan-binding domain-containing protein n=1 Tax=Handroanthus impetiginosus TaxID=429701 RepID=A0A2G9GT86_9LAMI|nr:hypothetical protein CDL12_18914 [Handroanthus impetiginosus]